MANVVPLGKVVDNVIVARNVWSVIDLSNLGYIKPCTTHHLLVIDAMVGEIRANAARITHSLDDGRTWQPLHAVAQEVQELAIRVSTSQ